MKIFYFIVCLSFLMLACQEAKNEEAEAEKAEMISAQQMFEQNSKIVIADIENWEKETVDYSIYADDYIFLDTWYSAEKDSLTLAEVKESDIRALEMFDFELLEDPVLLPGVSSETKKMDGSVRYYGDWKVTLPATDSTEMRSGVVKTYSSYDFNEDGKIIYAQMYGDFTGLMNDLMGMKDATPMEKKQ